MSPAGLPAVAASGSVANPPAEIIKGTVRYRLRISHGGSQIRLRFSNENGDVPMMLQSVSVGLSAHGLTAGSQSLRKVAFGGRGTIAVPAGAPELSDPVIMPVKALSDLVVSVYAPDGIVAFECAFYDSPDDQGVSEGSDATLSESLPVSRCLHTKRSVVSQVDILADHPRGVVVALGDSITDGGVDPKTGERGWPGVLARRLPRGFPSSMQALEETGYFSQIWGPVARHCPGSTAMCFPCRGSAKSSYWRALTILE